MAAPRRTPSAPSAPAPAPGPTPIPIPKVRVRPGSFIVFESTSDSLTANGTKILTAELRRQEHDVVEVGAPEDGPLGQIVRTAVKQGHLVNRCLIAVLLAMDRVAQVEALVAEPLRRGQIVVCDRYVMSVMAKECSNCPPGCLGEVSPMPRTPDLTIFLEPDPRAVDPELGKNYDALFERTAVRKVDATQPSDKLAAEIFGALPVVP